MFDVQQELKTALDYIKTKQTDAALDVIENIIKTAELYTKQKQHDIDKKRIKIQQIGQLYRGVQC